MSFFSDFVWSQEEHRNMGAWSFINTRMENVVGKKVSVIPVSLAFVLHSKSSKLVKYPCLKHVCMYIR